MVTNKKKYGLPKERRIKRQKIFDKLLQEGESVFGYPLKIVFVQTELPHDVPYQVAFGVSKKRFKKAVKRNRVKRIMREAFRLNAVILEEQKNLALLMIYVSKDLPDFHGMMDVTGRLLNRIKEKIRDGKTQ